MAVASDTTLRFARQISQIGQRGLSPADKEQVRRLLLDLLGVSLMGATMPWSKAMAEWARRFDGSGKAPVVGTNLRVAPTIACLANGTACHGYELDDTHDESMSHPGAVVIPAALALATELDSSFDDVLSAIAAGYEAMTRVGMAANAKLVMTSGHHPTPLFGGFGSAAAAASLYGLDEHGLVRAWGHVLSMAGGSMQFSDEEGGTAVKRVHAGYASHNGVLAAELAARSVGAPTQALDGKYGFLSLFSKEPSVDALFLQADEPLQIHNISIKPYSCCRLFHSLIDALGEVSDNYSLSPEKIVGINVGGPHVIFDQHMLRRPTSPMAAQYSLPYIVGATLAYGPYDYDSYQQHRLQDPRILRLADQVEGEMDPELEAHCPKRLGGAVVLTLADGSTKAAKVLDSRGTAANPLTTPQLMEKASRLTDEIELDVDVDVAKATVWTATSGRRVAELFGGSRPESKPDAAA
ncbi:MAG: MmgE/PrpD family protein [Rhizobiaceae bacterium]|nr:MmgE/PrpD family protein [Rhizobiaceae bacterium]